MFKKRFTAFVAALLPALTLLTACAQGAGENTPQAKDELVISVGGGTGGSYDACEGYGSSGVSLFYTCLLKINDDMQVEPDLAKSFTVSEDGLTYTYELRDDILFSDGEPFTAEDVVFTYETCKERGTGVNLTMLESVEAPDDHTVVFTLSEPYSPFIRQTALQGIVAKHAYGETYAANPVATGPFVVKQCDVGQQLIIEPNPHYYGTKSPFTQITLLSIDEETALSYALSGMLDVVMVNPEYAREEVPGMHLETFATSDNRGWNLPVIAETVNAEGETVGNNVTSDVAVRRALNMGIDREEIIDNALNGIGEASWVRFANLPWANMEPGLKDGDVEGAIAVLEEAGWIDEDGDGVREKDGVSCAFTITGRTDDLQRYNLAVALAQNAEKLGIKITAEALDWATCQQQARHIPTCIGTGSYNFIDVCNAFSSEYAGIDTVSLSNSGMYTNETTDSYLEKALHATSEEEAIENLLLAQYDGETGPNADFPYIWICNIDHTYFVRDGLNVGKQRVHPHGHGTPVIQNLTEWTFTE